MKKVLITGVAGFIGFHLAHLLSKNGFQIIGLDGMTDYYDVELKKARIADLSKNINSFNFHEIMLEDKKSLKSLFETECPNIVIHLAAQAGVRYSIENPRSYLDSNIVGTFNILELCIDFVDHLLLASTSSVYGANKTIPFREDHKTDNPMSFYAATKKATEELAHSISHINGLPITCFRFFSVYGPWGRPDMALFKFVKNILRGEPIDVYNYGKMKRDFTYVEDLAYAIYSLIDCVPQINKKACNHDNISPVAPFRSVNIGNSKIVELNDFIEEIERCLDKTAVKNYLPMQAGDVAATYADTTVLKALTGFVPSTDYRVGVRKFVDWYNHHYEGPM